MDENYLKMVLALPDEFFEGWEWKAGDKVYARNWNMEFLVSFVSPNGVSATKLNNLTPTITINPDVPINENIRPILSQEQLQKISKLDWDLYYYDLLKRYSDYDTAEQAGLAMIMYAKYAKKWDGEAWL